MVSNNNLLEQSFASICEEHDLKTLSITFHPEGSTRAFFNASAHWDHKCASGNSDTVAQAIGSAIAHMQAERGKAAPVALAEAALTGEPA